MATRHLLIFALVSITGSKPTAFEAVSFQQVVPLAFCGASPRPAADALVGVRDICGFHKSRTGGPARIGGSAPQNQWHCAAGMRQALQATFSRNQSYRLPAGSCLVHTKAIR